MAWPGPALPVQARPGPAWPGPPSHGPGPARPGSARRDAAPLAQPVLPLARESNDHASGDDIVQGFEALSVDAQVPPAVASFLLRELRALGVVHVAEVAPGDWPQLQAWVMLRPYERRRLLSVAGAQREFA